MIFFFFFLKSVGENINGNFLKLEYLVEIVPAFIFVLAEDSYYAKDPPLLCDNSCHATLLNI